MGCERRRVGEAVAAALRPKLEAALRERCRDRFLDLLRDYEAARRDANRERLFPPADDAFFFRKRRPQRRGARQTRDAFRDRASQVCGAVPPEHVGWFARVFTYILTAAGGKQLYLDDLTGQPLPEDLVKKGRKLELDYFRDKQVLSLIHI